MFEHWRAPTIFLKKYSKQIVSEVLFGLIGYFINNIKTLESYESYHILCTDKISTLQTKFLLYKWLLHIASIKEVLPDFGSEYHNT